MKRQNLHKLVLAALLIAVGVACSPFSIPIGASKCFPVQHMVNVLAAVMLGPWYGVAMAFLTSLLRVLLGTGSLLAFPGSMCGALLCGLLYHYKKSLLLTYLGEVFGTSILGGMLAYPIATLVMSNQAALFSYVLPFFVSTAGGTLLASALIFALQKTHVLERFIHERA